MHMHFDSSRYKVYTPKHWMMIHWVINPALMVNELLLGQRIPKITLEDKTLDKVRFERTFVPCPHCNTLHDSRTWSVQNKTAFWHWFGLYCPACSGIIPCLRNIFSLIVLAVTYPIWGWFRKRMKRAWLERQPVRYQNIDLTTVPFFLNTKGWISLGLGWGAFMLVGMGIIYPLLDTGEIDWRQVLIGIPLWTITGLAFGYTMKLFGQHRGKPQTARN